MEATTARAAPGAPAQAIGRSAATPAASGLDHAELVDAISQRLAQNFAKALHQSIAEAVGDCLGNPIATAPRQPSDAERNAGRATAAPVPASPNPAAA